MSAHGYFLPTFQLPLTTSLPLAFSRSDHVPVALLPSNVATSTISACGCGVKSYLAVIFLPSNAISASVASYEGSPVTDTLPPMAPSFVRSSVNSKPPDDPAPSQVPVHVP